MGLLEIADRLAGTYSGGNKRKLVLGMALLGNPRIILLDEPSNGMDPEARRFMWKVLSSITQIYKNCSLVLITQFMDEAEALSNRVGIMKDGELKVIGRLN